MDQILFEDSLEEGLQLSLSSYEQPTIELPDVPYDRWLSASAVHKSIRRGLIPLGLRSCRDLIANDGDYFWRRLTIFALEEVGMTDPDLVGQAMWVSGKGGWRAAHGGDQFVAQNIISRLCESAKDRNACQIPVAAALMHEHASERTRPIYETIRNLWLMGTGPIDGDTYRLPATHKVAALDALAALGIPAKVRCLFDLATRKTIESMSLGLVGTWLLRDEQSTSVESESLIGVEVVGGFPACVFDKHTRKGKQALTELARYPDIACYLTRVYEKANAVGLALFELESQLANRRLTYSDWAEPMRLSTKGWLIGLGMSELDSSGFVTAVKARLPSLHLTRARLVEE